MNTKQISKEKNKQIVLKNLVESKGIATIACDNSGLSTRVFYIWMKEDEAFKKEVENIRESAIDYVEGKLFELIKNNEPSAIYFFLKCQGKKRGWVEKQEHSIELPTPGENPLFII